MSDSRIGGEIDGYWHRISLNLSPHPRNVSKMVAALTVLIKLGVQDLLSIGMAFD